MDKLPTELLEKICYACHSTKELKSLRFVNRIFSELAARALFQEVYVALLEESLSKLLQISAHPRLRLYVNSICFLQNLLREPWVSDPWTRSRNSNEDTRSPNWTHGLVPNVEITKERFRLANLCHVDIYERHRTILDEGRDLRTTSLAISRFPNLQSVATYELSRYSRDSPTTSKDAEDSPTPFLSELQRITLLQYPFQDYDGIFISQASIDFARPIVSLVKALSEAGGSCHVRDFTIDYIPFSFWNSDLPCSYWASTHPRARVALQHVRVMNLKFRMEESGNPALESNPPRNQIISFLESAPQVEIIRIYFYDIDYRFRSASRAPNVSDIFRRVTWPNLKEIELGECNMSQKAFLDFMRRHSRNLRTLRIGYLETEDLTMTWKEAFQSLAPVMNLKTVRIHILLDKEIGRFVHRNKNLSWPAARSKKYFGGIARYLELRGKAQYPSLV